MERRQNIEDLSKARRSKLEESRKLQQFERDADEVKSWITEKLKIARDESYKVRNNVTGTYCYVKMAISTICDKVGW